jgi:hypothetical protein
VRDGKELRQLVIAGIDWCVTGADRLERSDRDAGQAEESGDLRVRKKVGSRLLRPLREDRSRLLAPRPPWTGIGPTLRS